MISDKDKATLDAAVDWICGFGVAQTNTITIIPWVDLVWRRMHTVRVKRGRGQRRNRRKPLPRRQPMTWVVT